MEAKKRKAIEVAGWKVGDAADFLGMSAEERQLLDARIALAHAVRVQRESVKMSQKELGARMKTSQPRIAKIEQASSDVSLDQLVRALAAAGGKVVVSSQTGKLGKNKSPGKNASTIVLQVAATK